MWTGSEESLFPVVDIFHKRGKPPAFTAGGRVIHKGPQSELESFSLSQGSQDARNGADELGKSMDSLFKTVFGLLLPVMVASALNGSAADNDKKRNGFRYHKRHHHHKHHKHRHRSDDDHQQVEQDGHTHVASTLRRSAVEPTVAALSAAAGPEAPSNSSVAGTSEQVDNPSTNQGGGAGWLLLTGLAVTICIAIVAAGRALLVRKLRKNSWEIEDAQLMERPHAN